MDNLKYRIWDKDHKCFVDENNDLMMNMTVSEAGGTDIFTIDYYGHGKMVMYAGVEDGKGEEVFEGDILQEQHISDSYGVVEKDTMSNNLVVVWHYKDKYDGQVFWSRNILGILAARNYMVVGNIYENPELLKSEVEQ